nr:MAG TPA: hypothetical protein [Caudoviricetes sp.]
MPRGDICPSPLPPLCHMVPPVEFLKKILISQKN